MRVWEQEMGKKKQKCVYFLHERENKPYGLFVDLLYGVSENVSDLKSKNYLQ